MADRSGERWVAQLPSTAAIQDPQVRMFLDTLKNAWELRNGDTGQGDDARFITKGEVENATMRALGQIFGVGTGGPGGTGPGSGGSGQSNRAIIDRLANWVINSELFRRLNTRIDNLEVPWDTVNQVNTQVAVLRGWVTRMYALLGFPDGLFTVPGATIPNNIPIFPNGVTNYMTWLNNTATSVTALSVTVGNHTSQLAVIGEVNANQATLITNLQTTVNGQGSSITELFSTTSTQATAITALQTTVNGHGSSISSLQTTTANQATSITNLQTTANGYGSRIATLETTTASQATSITTLSTTVGAHGSSISSLEQTTANQATSISQLQTTTANQTSSISSLQQTTSNQATSISSLQTTTNNQSSQIGTLQTTTDNQATAISNLQTTVNGQATSISTLQTTTNGQATTISNIQSTLNSQATSIGNINTQISEINNIAVNSTSAAAQNIYMMRSTLDSGEGPMGRIYWSDGAPSGGTYIIGDRWVDTNSNPLYQVHYWNGTTWTTTVTSFRSYVDAGMTTEQNTRATRDSALARAINTLWAVVNNGGTYVSSIIEDGTLANAGAVAASAARWNSLQSAVLGPNGNQNLVAQVRQDFDTYVNADTGRANASYTVRVNANGNIAGFGLMATYNTTTGAMNSAGPSSAFGVVADSFWIAAPGQAAVESGQVDPTKVPFVALTSPATIDGFPYPAGVFIKNAVIADASIDVAKIKDNIRSQNYVANTSGWYIGIRGTDDGYAEFSNVKIRGTSVVNRLVIEGAVEGSVYIPNNSYACVTHNENRKVMITLWSADGYAASINYFNDYSFCIQMGGNGGVCYYRYF